MFCEMYFLKVHGSVIKDTRIVKEVASRNITQEPHLKKQEDGKERSS